MPSNAPHDALRHHVSGAVARGEAEPIVGIEADADADDTDRCPACGQPIDYCQGHGEIGDPVGAAILARHDDGDHTTCDPRGCDDVPARLTSRLAGPAYTEVHVFWDGLGTEPSPQRVTGAARREAGGSPVRRRFVDRDRYGSGVTYVYGITK